jgi:SNF2 family DNA or RNA helicase
VIYCPQTPLQKKIHLLVKEKIVDRKNEYRMKGTIPKQLVSSYNSSYDDNYSFQNILMQLRKICNHPYLFLEDITSIPDDLYFKDLLEASGKLQVLDKLLDQFIAQKSQVPEHFSFSFLSF